MNTMDRYYRRAATFFLVWAMAMLMAGIGIGMFFRSQ